MKRILIVLCFAEVMLTGITSAQLQGDQWTIGYWALGEKDYSIMIINFKSDNISIEKRADIKIWFSETASNICSADGDVLLWSNGQQIMDIHGNSVADTIAYDGYDGFWEYFFVDSYQIPYGFPEPNGVLLLPQPGNNSVTSVIYNLAGDHPEVFWAPVQLLEAQVMQTDSETFQLSYKDKPIGPRREFYTGTISATRHANGRDWWVILFGEDSPEYYTHLLSPEGLQFQFTGLLDTTLREGLGQAFFHQEATIWQDSMLFRRTKARISLYFPLTDAQASWSVCIRLIHRQASTPA